MARQATATSEPSGGGQIFKGCAILLVGKCRMLAPRHANLIGPRIKPPSCSFAISHSQAPCPSFLSPPHLSLAHHRHLSVASSLIVALYCISTTTRRHLVHLSVSAAPVIPFCTRPLGLGPCTTLFVLFSAHARYLTWILRSAPFRCFFPLQARPWISALVATLPQL